MQEHVAVGGHEGYEILAQEKKKRQSDKVRANLISKLQLLEDPCRKGAMRENLYIIRERRGRGMNRF